MFFVITLIVWLIAGLPLHPLWIIALLVTLWLSK